jgi:hypothetical protein
MKQIEDRLTARIVVLMTPDEKKAYFRKCREHDSTPSDRVRALVKADLEAMLRDQDD